MQINENDLRTPEEKLFLTILSNTAKAYNYNLDDEEMLYLLKRYGMMQYIMNYVKLVKENNTPVNTHIIDLGSSSLQRFLSRREKRVFQFAPNENDNLLIIRDAECSSKLKLNFKQHK